MPVRRRDFRHARIQVVRSVHSLNAKIFLIAYGSLRIRPEQLLWRTVHKCQGKRMLKPWQAGLLAFIGSTVLFLGVPLPAALTLREQVSALVAFQAIATVIAMLIAWLRTYPQRSQTFDIVSRRKKRAKLRIVH